MKVKIFVSVLAVSAGYILGFLWEPSGPSTGKVRDGSTSIARKGRSHEGATGDPREAALSTAISELLQPGGDLRGLVAFGEALEQLDSRQFAQLLEVLERNHARGSDDRLGWLFKRWLKQDPSAAMTWLQPRLDSLAQDGPLGFTITSDPRYTLAMVWAEADPQRAFEYARSQPRSGLAKDVLWKVMDQWKARSDRERLALLLDFPSGNARDAALQRLHDDWAARDPGAAFASAQSLPEGPARDRTIRDVLIAWGKKDTAAAFAQYRALGLNNSALLSKLLAGSAAKNPMQAVGFLQQLDPLQFGRCAPQVVESWARSDPAAALGWALANGVRLSWQSDSTTRVEHNGFGRSVTTGGGSVRPLDEALKSKPQETLAWLQSLPPGAERDRVMELAIKSCRDHEQALQLFEKLPPEAAARAARTMGYKFMNVPERAREWALSLPSGPIRTAALESIGALRGTDVELPPGPDRDAFLSGTLNRVNSSSSPQTLAEKIAIIEQIGDPVLRRDVFDETMEMYAHRGFTSIEAHTALDAAKVPEEWKNQWREALPKAK